MGWFALVCQMFQRFRENNGHVPPVNFAEREVSISSGLKNKKFINIIFHWYWQLLSATVCTVRHKKLFIVIILDKLAFANKEAGFQIWSLKGRMDRDHRLILATSMIWDGFGISNWVAESNA